MLEKSLFDQKKQLTNSPFLSILKLKVQSLN